MAADTRTSFDLKSERRKSKRWVQTETSAYDGDDWEDDDLNDDYIDGRNIDDNVPNVPRIPDRFLRKSADRRVNEHAASNISSEPESEAETIDSDDEDDIVEESKGRWRPKTVIRKQPPLTPPTTKTEPEIAIKAEPRTFPETNLVETEYSGTRYDPNSYDETDLDLGKSQLQLKPTKSNTSRSSSLSSDATPIIEISDATIDIRSTNPDSSKELQNHNYNLPKMNNDGSSLHEIDETYDAVMDYYQSSSEEEKDNGYSGDSITTSQSPLAIPNIENIKSISVNSNRSSLDNSSESWSIKQSPELLVLKSENDDMTDLQETESPLVSPINDQVHFNSDDDEQQNEATIKEEDLSPLRLNNIEDTKPVSSLSETMKSLTTTNEIDNPKQDDDIAYRGGSTNLTKNIPAMKYRSLLAEEENPTEPIKKPSTPPTLNESETPVLKPDTIESSFDSTISASTPVSVPMVDDVLNEVSTIYSDFSDESYDGFPTLSSLASEETTTINEEENSTIKNRTLDPVANGSTFKSILQSPLIDINSPTKNVTFNLINSTSKLTKRPPSYKIDAISKLPNIKLRLEAYRKARLEEATYNTGLNEWLSSALTSSIYSTQHLPTLGPNVSSAYSEAQSNFNNSNSKRQHSTRRQLTTKFSRPKDVLHVPSVAMGKVGDGAHSLAKGFLLRRKKKAAA